MQKTDVGLFYETLTPKTNKSIIIRINWSKAKVSNQVSLGRKLGFVAVFVTQNGPNAVVRPLYTQRCTSLSVVSKHSHN